MTRMPDPSHAWRRFVRPAALVAAAGVGAVALAACDKPLPDVTFQSGSTSVLIAPSTYCWSQDNCKRGDGGNHVLGARGGSTVQISVPRSVADNAWIATAYTVDAQGKSSPLEGFGSNLVKDNHFTRVFVPTSQGSYLLSVSEFEGDRQSGVWTLTVNVTG